MNQGYGSSGGSGLPSGSRFNHASTLRRIGAYIIDSIILWFILMVLFLGFYLLGVVSLGAFMEIASDNITSSFFRTSYLFLVGLGAVINLTYFTFLESEKGGGSTLGKRFLNMGVVDEYGEKVAFGPSFIRNLARILWQIPCIGFIILIIDVFLIAESEQRIGDWLANTYVVKEEPSRAYSDYGQQAYTEQQQWSKGPSS